MSLYQEHEQDYFATEQQGLKRYKVAPGVVAELCEKCYLRAIEQHEMTRLERDRGFLSHASYTAIQPHRKG